MTSQLRRHYGTFYSFSVTRFVRMIRAKNYQKFSKFVKVTAKILSVPFFLGGGTRCTTAAAAALCVVAFKAISRTMIVCSLIRLVCIPSYATLYSRLLRSVIMTIGQRPLRHRLLFSSSNTPRFPGVIIDLPPPGQNSLGHNPLLCCSTWFGYGPDPASWVG